jgi:hypothetical protein
MICRHAKLSMLLFKPFGDRMSGLYVSGKTFLEVYKQWVEGDAFDLNVPSKCRRPSEM